VSDPDRFDCDGHLIVPEMFPEPSWEHLPTEDGGPKGSTWRPIAWHADDCRCAAHYPRPATPPKDWKP
jgi:hypothetical protein